MPPRPSRTFTSPITGAPLPASWIESWSPPARAQSAPVLTHDGMADDLDREADDSPDEDES